MLLSTKISRLAHAAKLDVASDNIKHRRGQCKVEQSIPSSKPLFQLPDFSSKIIKCILLIICPPDILIDAKEIITFLFFISSKLQQSELQTTQTTATCVPLGTALLFPLAVQH